jgi:hypothetical protein
MFGAHHPRHQELGNPCLDDAVGLGKRDTVKADWYEFKSIGGCGFRLIRPTTVFHLPGCDGKRS